MQASSLLNIVQFGNFSAHAVNGVATAGYALAQAQHDLGHAVSIYSIDSTDTDSSVVGGITKKEFARQKSLFRLPASLTQTLDLMQSETDIFHLHSVFTPANFALSRYLRKSGIPFVVTSHGGYDPNILKRNRLKKTLYWHLFEKRCLHAASGVVCVTEREIADIRALGYRGAVTVIPNPVQKPPSPTRSIEPTLIFLGRWDIRHKGLDRLLDLFRHIEKIDPTVRLKLYGDGQRSSLENYARQLGLRNVELCGPVFGPDKWSVLSRAAIYVQPSRWEVFGVSIVESMMAGIPVCLARECYLSDLISRVGCGLVLDKFDAQEAKQIVDLAHDRKANLEIGLKGQAYANSEFDASVVAQKTCDFYHSILRT